MRRFFIIDFDSTLIQVESLDILSEIALRNCPDREKRLSEVREITASGMEGGLPFSESLKRRIALLKIKRSDIDELVDVLKKEITPSFLEHKNFLQEHADDIYIVTGGFVEYVSPVVEILGLKATNVRANVFKFNEQGVVIGFDESNSLCKDGGKAEVIRDLKLDGELIVIGDGHTDYEVKAAIPSAHFVAFTENVIRDVVVEKADRVVDSFSDVIYISDEPVRLSYPKNKIRVLLLEQVHPRAVEIFKDEGYQVESLGGSLDKEALCNKMHKVSILGIRSKTYLTSDVFKASKTLLAVGAFCIGTDQIDLLSASESGVSVINAPYSNTRSVVELALGEIIMLMRRAIDSSRTLHEGKWQKSASGCFEVRGKKLGIVGYGNIGSQLSVLAESLGMNVYYYDVVEKLSLGNARKCKSLQELLRISDVVTLHVDGRAANVGLIGIREFNLMKEGVVFLNLSRGSVVDTNSLVQSLKSGKVAGAAVDVFQNEPKNNEEEFFSELRGLHNVILTPHIGGSTHEAQENIAEFVAERIISYINTGNSVGSVNFPEIALPPVFGAHRLLHVHKNVPGILAEINGTLARFKINILGQYLKTTERIGYVITDVNKEYNSELIDTLKSIPNTIRFRVLY